MSREEREVLGMMWRVRRERGVVRFTREATSALSFDRVESYLILSCSSFF